MNTIYKYPFEITDEQQLQIHKPGKFRHIGLDPQGQPCIWAEVDPEKETREVTLLIVGTGHPLPPNASTFIGSFNQGPFMWHAYVQ